MQGFAANAINATAAPKQPAMQTHAERLHDLAERLSSQVNRLGGFIDRVQPAPPSDTAGREAPQPAPTGTLLVAQFGAEKISLEIDRLNAVLNRLESIG